MGDWYDTNHDGHHDLGEIDRWQLDNGGYPGQFENGGSGFGGKGGGGGFFDFGPGLFGGCLKVFVVLVIIGGVFSLIGIFASAV